MPSADLLKAISGLHPNVEKISDEGNDTARSYKVPGYRGSFGFISSLSDHFCATCNRLRLTADGQIKVERFSKSSFALTDTDLHRFVCLTARKSLCGT